MQQIMKICGVILIKQYYILARDTSNELHYMVYPAEDAEQLIDKVKQNKDIVEIVNFSVRLHSFNEGEIAEPEPEWFKRKKDDKQLTLF
jgi:hypothetical protein